MPSRTFICMKYFLLFIFALFCASSVLWSCGSTQESNKQAVNHYLDTLFTVDNRKAGKVVEKCPETSKMLVMYKSLVDYNFDYVDAWIEHVSPTQKRIIFTTYVKALDTLRGRGKRLQPGEVRLEIELYSVDPEKKPLKAGRYSYLSPKNFNRYVVYIYTKEGKSYLYSKPHSQMDEVKDLLIRSLDSNKVCGEINAFVPETNLGNKMVLRGRFVIPDSVRIRKRLNPYYNPYDPYSINPYQPWNPYQQPTQTQQNPYNTYQPPWR